MNKSIIRTYLKEYRPLFAEFNAKIIYQSKEGILRMIHKELNSSVMGYLTEKNVLKWLKDTLKTLSEKAQNGK